MFGIEKSIIGLIKVLTADKNQAGTTVNCN
jgi:hypothetical protein